MLDTFGREGISTEYGVHDERNVADGRPGKLEFRQSAELYSVTL